MDALVYLMVVCLVWCFFDGLRMQRKIKDLTAENENLRQATALLGGGALLSKQT